MVLDENTDSTASNATIAIPTLTPATIITLRNINSDQLNNADVVVQEDIENLIKINFGCLSKHIQQMHHHKSTRDAEYQQTEVHLQNRIVELEDALRESVAIAMHRENEYAMLDIQKTEMIDKLRKMEQRILSLKTANFLRCTSCRRTTLDVNLIRKKVAEFLSIRQNTLRELTDSKQEILELLLSEQDTQIALFEVFGVKTQYQIERLDRLRSDRCKLNQRLKVESENSIALLSECKLLEEELSQLLTQKEPILDDFD